MDLHTSVVRHSERCSVDMLLFLKINYALVFKRCNCNGNVTRSAAGTILFLVIR